MSTSSGNPLEDKRRAALRAKLNSEFEIYEEVWVRHALFRHRWLRMDMLAIAQQFPDVALGFEVKGHDDWDVPSLSKALKQAGDYVLSTVEPDSLVPSKYHGLRVMMAFVYPGIDGIYQLSESGEPKRAFLAGMVQGAIAHRVGHAIETSKYRGAPLALCQGPNELWVAGRGWRSDASNILLGQRQIGSQRFNILDELKQHKSDSQ